jgi:hypothetical protein
MTDLDYKILRLKKDPASLAAHTATSYRIFRHRKSEDASSPADAVRHAMVCWRARLRALRIANWVQVHTDKYWYGLNCPPVGVEMTGGGTLPCRLRACPFCHGRRIRDIFIRLNKRLESQGSLSLVEFRGHYGPKLNLANRDLLQLRNGRLDWDRMDDTLRRMSVRRRRIKKRLARGDYGGAYQVSFNPRVVNKQVALAGWWASDHRVLAAVDAKHAEDPPVFAFGKVTYHRVQSAYVLAKLVGRVLPYNLAWLYADAEVMADLLNILHSRRLFTTIGKL